MADVAPTPNPAQRRSFAFAPPLGVLSAGLVSELVLPPNGSASRANIDYAAITAAATLLGGQAGGAISGGSWKPGGAYVAPELTPRKVKAGCSSCGGGSARPLLTPSASLRGYEPS
jgi:hypothetical protein